MGWRMIWYIFLRKAHGGRVLSYMGYVGMCCCLWYGVEIRSERLGQEYGIIFQETDQLVEDLDRVTWELTLKNWNGQKILIYPQLGLIAKKTLTSVTSGK